VRRPGAFPILPIVCLILLLVYLTTQRERGCAIATTVDLSRTARALAWLHMQEVVRALTVMSPLQ
jgi:hypothetical protein